MEIDLKKIRKKYNDEVILDKINLSFKSGEVYFVVGESGCGKSTLLKIIAGLIDDYEGSVLINNKNLKDIDVQYVRKELITYIDQYSYLLEYLTINENIDFILNKRIRKRFTKKYRYYSGGEKRRIATYVSSLKSSEIILADEISSSLDKENALKVMNYLRKIAKNKVLIVVTHDLFLVNDHDHLIDLTNPHSQRANCKERFKYKENEQKENYLTLFKYSFLKLVSNQKYIFNFVSSFIVGLVLILLISSLKTGIISFLDNEVLHEFNYNYLLLQSDDLFYYGDNEKFNSYVDDSLILLDDFYFDQSKNKICTIDKENLIYFEENSQLMVSKALLKQNNYSYDFNIKGFNIYINNIFDSNEFIIKCPFSFFADFYQFKGYKLSDVKSKNIVLYIEDSQTTLDIYKDLEKDFINLRIKNVGIDAYFYINDLLYKIQILLMVFIIVSLLITLFLILTLIKLDIKEEDKEISYLKISGHNNLFVFLFYYLTNLYRGVITFTLTLFFYSFVIFISNKILMIELGLNHKLLEITSGSIIMIALLIVIIITISMLFNVKELKVHKK